MYSNIGDNAGKIWRYLSQNGSAPLKTLHKSVGIEKEDSERALGWLAREGKLSFDEASKGGVRIALRS